MQSSRASGFLDLDLLLLLRRLRRRKRMYNTQYQTSPQTFAGSGSNGKEIVFSILLRIPDPQEDGEHSLVLIGRRRVLGRANLAR
jgi:hypothetical protein